MKPLEASLFKPLPEELKQQLILSGVVPVNDVFFNEWESDDKILFLFGGYGSGKSVFIVDKLLKECQNKDQYFRCFYGRKVYDSVRISIFATLCDRIEELNLSSKFTYSKADNSSMIIKCKETGHTFNPFGADNIDKLKSVKDPSHILCEELDQFTEKDFGVLLSRLRTIKTKTQFIGIFNTTKVVNTHWLKQAFFTEESEKRKQYSHHEIKKVFCNYTDNYFINHKEYEQTLWISAGFHEQTFKEIAAGAWGSIKPDDPFCICFNRDKHVGKVKPMPLISYIASFDFNVNPLTAGIYQHIHLPNGRVKVNCIESIKLANSDIYKLCDYINVKYPGVLWEVTGDATGRNTSALVQDGINYYTVIKAKLNLSQNQLKVPSVNPPIQENRVLVNAVFHNYDVTFDKENAADLIFDCEYVSVDDMGKIEKGDRTNPKKRADHLDHFRYYCNTFHKHALKS